MNKKLPRDFYLRKDTIEIAKDLLGKLIVVPDDEGRRVSGMIVETEAYLGVEDLRGKRIWLEDHRSFTDDEIAVGKRIGIDSADEDADRPWRFWVRGNEFVSKGQNRER